MKDQSVRQAAIALYDRYTHAGMDRRAFMAELSRLAGSAAAAGTLLAAIAADPAGAAIVPTDDPRLKIQQLEWESRPGRTMRGYAAAPTTGTDLPLVIVIHENRGLNDHIRDVARRFALAGFSAVAPDFLTPAGGTPADADQAREMIGKLDLAAAVDDGVSMVGWLSAPQGGSRRVGVTGFCWGGAMVNRIAVAAGPKLRAGVSFYGTAPAPAEAAKVEAAMMLHLAGLDDRVNATALPWAAGLRASGKRVESFVYPGVNHAFHNDTSAERYDAAAAGLAWQRTLDFFGRTLAA